MTFQQKQDLKDAFKKWYNETIKSINEMKRYIQSSNFAIAKISSNIEKKKN